jgi:tRNA G18 (ribose-2'-O)-methylase SpoU
MDAKSLRHNPRFEHQAQYNGHLKNDLYIVTDSVFDTMNLGQICRLSEALSAKETIFCGPCELPHNKKVRSCSVKTSDFINWSHYHNVTDALKSLKTLGATIVGVELHPRAKKHTEVNFGALKGPIALVLGNESWGVSQPALDLCDELVYIKMHGLNRSLNVSVALSIIGFKILEK